MSTETNIATVSTVAGQLPTIELLPEEIVVEDNVRPFEDPDSAEEIELISLLAQSIKTQGQVQPGRVEREPGPNGVDTYRLIAGSRRRRAIAFLNDSAPNGTAPVKMRVEVQEGGTRDTYRQALAENIQRKNFSPMEIAFHISKIRGRYAWKGEKGTAKVAEYMGVSRATITEHEKYNDLPADLQRDLHSGKITGKAALEMLAAVKRGADPKAVAEAAREIASTDTSRQTGTGKAKVQKGAVKAKHVRQAVKQTKPEAATGPQKLNRNEIVDSFLDLRGPVIGFPDGDVWQFLDYFEKYCAGKGSYATFEKKFLALTEKCNKGTKASVKEEKPEKPTAAPKKKTPAPKTSAA